MDLEAFNVFLIWWF